MSSSQFGTKVPARKFLFPRASFRSCLVTPPITRSCLTGTSRAVRMLYFVGSFGGRTSLVGQTHDSPLRRPGVWGACSPRPSDSSA